MKHFPLYVFFFSLTLCSLLSAQEIPPIEVYTPRDYRGENQNWAISQSKDKTIYIANNKGLLEFNGARWELYPSPNETIIRSVKVIEDRIYTGCYMEFGYWKRNFQGKLVYSSLSQLISNTMIEDEQFWNIIGYRDWVLFQSLNRIYIYHTATNDFKWIDTNFAITKMYQVGETVYFQQIGDGLYRLENGQPIVVSKSSELRDYNIINVFEHQDKLLVETQEHGFFIVAGAAVSPWDIPASNLLNQVSVYSSIKLQDGTFALGTISNGLIHLTEDGIANYQINQTRGLSNNTILALFEDEEDNIWLGLDNGINCVNITSPFEIYNDDKGELGTTYASAIYKGNLYLGTNQGLFVRPVEAKTPFQFVEGTKGQVWCLTEYDNLLFCGHNAGTFIVEGNKAESIAEVDGTWGIKTIPQRPDLLLQGNYNGLNVLQKTNGKWHFRNKIEGFNISAKHFEILDSMVFVSHEYKGVFKIRVDEDYLKAIKFEKDATIEQGLNSSLVKYKDRIVYAFRKGVFSYDKDLNKFQRDEALSKLFDEDTYTSGKLVVHNNTGYLWGFSQHDIGYATTGMMSEVPNIRKIAFPNALRKGMTGYENISYIKDNHYLFGSSTGYVIINTQQQKANSYHIFINNINNQRLQESTTALDITTSGDFNYQENNFEFLFSIPEFDKFQRPEYQYRLIGFNDTWSEWSNRTYQTYNNLPHGNFTFEVRGRVGTEFTENVASYSFKIAKPFYISHLALALYTLVILLFSIFMHHVYKRYYRRQQDKLLQEAERELELKELENQQQLMQFKNDSLQQDVESKSRELAISTMSLIKKNEFLNAIKDELKDNKSDSKVKSVIKIIDKNLNNSDDWTFFEEAFNNADKDFLKKIKSKHPSLTPNDLKLCAYLRLNLSSKDIAPLLNISVKSVEVKRYRLRKKMDLPHESSLTNYILEL